MRKPEHITRAACAIADAVAGAGAGVIAYLVRFETGWIPIEGRVDVLPKRYLEALPVTICALVLGVALSGAYRPAALKRPASLSGSIRSAVLGGLVLATLALTYRDAFQYSRLAVAIVSAAFVPTQLASRSAALGVLRRLAARGRLGASALLAASDGRQAEIRAAIATEPWPATRFVTQIGPEAGISGLEDIVARVERGEVDEIVIACRQEDAPWERQLLRRLESTSVDVRVAPDLSDEILLNPAATVIAGVPVLSVRESPLYGVSALSKRIVDITLAALLLVLLGPVIAALALAVRNTSPGPALYRQERAGLDGCVFSILKLRTMRVDAEVSTGAVRASPGDARVTPIGRVLRRWSLDELPQLWNVLRGEMSLVGPRPERPELIERFRREHPGYMLRQSVKAGVTGWAQVHGLRGNTSLEDRLRLDLEYIDRWSIWLDLEILLRTIVHVAKGDNAY